MKGLVIANAIVIASEIVIASARVVVTVSATVIVIESVSMRDREAGRGQGNVPNQGSGHCLGDVHLPKSDLCRASGQSHAGGRQYVEVRLQGGKRFLADLQLQSTRIFLVGGLHHAGGRIPGTALNQFAGHVRGTRDLTRGRPLEMVCNRKGLGQGGGLGQDAMTNRDVNQMTKDDRFQERESSQTGEESCPGREIQKRGEKWKGKENIRGGENFQGRESLPEGESCQGSVGHHEEGLNQTKGRRLERTRGSRRLHESHLSREDKRLESGEMSRQRTNGSLQDQRIGHFRGGNQHPGSAPILISRSLEGNQVQESDHRKKSKRHHEDSNLQKDAPDQRGSLHLLDKMKVPTRKIRLPRGTPRLEVGQAPRSLHMHRLEVPPEVHPRAHASTSLYRHC